MSSPISIAFLVCCLFSFLCSATLATEDKCGSSDLSFRCDTDRCVSYKVLCNGVFDCDDEIDESEVVCKKLGASLKKLRADRLPRGTKTGIAADILSVVSALLPQLGQLGQSIMAGIPEAAPYANLTATVSQVAAAVTGVVGNTLGKLNDPESAAQYFGLAQNVTVFDAATCDSQCGPLVCP